ncbi:MAG TPA: lipoyl synthase [Bacteroidales bacterium]|nr:lipoyl synthase [Bacteroidales bacterium]HOR81769.1 lipoyl synthase [Bacteroidales bacterium]HPJ92121.1 lipoyl synthase [Bacteroidales bacterium]
MSENIKKPNWLKIKLESGENFEKVKQIVHRHHLHTICESGKCPNRNKCWTMGTATFMILGDICTRSCKFCATKTGKPLPVDDTEPMRLSESIRLMNLNYCVITSVDRDDLSDKGAKHWHDCILAVRQLNPQTKIEVLIPDFDGNPEWIQSICDAAPDVIGHNLETIKRLTPLVRSRANYTTSLQTLEYIAKAGFVAKSGIMVGIGETQDEVIELMKDLRSINCELLTIGQYLQPTPQNLAITEYVHPDVFDFYKKEALALGFKAVESGPYVRSSFMAEQSYMNSKI